MSIKMDTHQQIAAIAKDAAQAWSEAQRWAEYTAYYLYYRDAPEHGTGDLVISANAPPGYNLASLTRISTGWTIEDAAKFVREQARTLPILPLK